MKTTASFREEKTNKLDSIYAVDTLGGAMPMNVLRTKERHYFAGPSYLIYDEETGQLRIGHGASAQMESLSGIKVIADAEDFPAKGKADTLYVSLEDAKLFVWNPDVESWVDIFAAIPEPPSHVRLIENYYELPDTPDEETLYVTNAGQIFIYDPYNSRYNILSEGASYTKEDSDRKYAASSEVYTKDESNDRFAAKSDTYTKSESDNKYAEKQSVYTKAESDARLNDLRNTTYTKDESNDRFMAMGSAYTKSESDSKYELAGTAYEKSETDDKFALKDNVYNKETSDSKYAKKGEAYTKEESDDRYEQKGTAYAKSEADDKFADKDSLYTKQESDNKYALKSETYTKSEVADLYTSKDDVYTKLAADDKFAQKDTSYTKQDSDERYAKTGDAYTKTESDSKYAGINTSFTKDESDERYALKNEAINTDYLDNRYEQKGVAYSKADSDNKYAGKNASYTKAESDEKYLSRSDITDIEDSIVINTSPYCKDIFNTENEAAPTFILSRKIAGDINLYINGVLYQNTPNETNYEYNSESNSITWVNTNKDAGGFTLEDSVVIVKYEGNDAWEGGGRIETTPQKS